MIEEEVKISCYFKSQCFNIDYDKSLGLEIFISLVISIIEETNENELILLDYAGRRITNDQDLNLILSNSNDVSIWCLNSSDVNEIEYSLIHSNKTTQLMNDSCCMVDTNYQLCTICRDQLDPSLISLNSFELKSLTCNSKELSELGILSNITNTTEIIVDYPIELYITRKIYENSIQNQELIIQKLNNSKKNEILNKRKEFESRLQSGIQVIKVYQDLNQQNIARSAINYEKIIEYTNKYQTENIEWKKDICMLHGLLQWFKCDFFQWCNKPSCDHCQTAGAVEIVGMTAPTVEESQQGL